MGWTVKVEIVATYTATERQTIEIPFVVLLDLKHGTLTAYTA